MTDSELRLPPSIEAIILGLGFDSPIARLLAQRIAAEACRLQIEDDNKRVHPDAYENFIPVVEPPK